MTGKILDGDFDDVLSFANVTVKNTNYGASTDFDGKYSINMEPGTYTVVYSFVGYSSKEITDVVIKAGEVTIVDVTLNASAAALDDIVITVTRRQNSEKAVLEVQKNSTVVLDGLSSETIKKAGSSSVASAVKAVPGVSVQDGKFVYVRGLGDRYTKTLLNGMEVPGLDPDKNALQLDIFPTGVLENLQVKKSSTADLTADFTGGIVDILTKDIPSSEEYSLSFSLGYNPDMHFNDDYLSYNGGDTDFLGFDDGTRDSPIAAGTNIPLLQQDGSLVRELTQRFNPELAAMREKSFMNFGFSFSGGNKYKFDSGNSLGFTASLAYKNDTDFYENFVDGQIFRKNADTSVLTPTVDRSQQGAVGVNNILLNGLLGLTYKTEFSKYRINVLHIQNGESNAALITQQNAERSSNQIKKDVLTYTERALTNVLLSGEHNNKDGSWNTEWKISPTLSRVDDKDFRTTPFRIDGSTATIEPSEAGDPTRLYRELQELNLASRIDFTRKHQLFNESAKLKFGAGFTYKNRDFSVDQYSFILQNFQSSNFNGDPNEILAPDNIYDPNTGSGVAVRSDFNITNNFDSQITIGSAYVSDEFQLTNRLKTILGVRFEKFDLTYNGQNQQGQVFDNEKFIDKADVFPSLNLIYDLNEDSNFKLRGSFSITTARPSFKEASEAEIFDPISNFFFIGNRDIQPTYINNFDVRLEKYGEGSDFYAISTFYKDFKDPIELSFIREAEGQFTPPLNLGNATVLGAEIELRKNLGFVPALKNFNATLNVSIIDSNQNYSEDEENNRRDTLRDGQTLDDTRPLQGQSPYLVNAGLVYETESDLRIGAFFNVQGRTLEIVGSGDIPDVYTLPFNSLNFTANKTFGETVKHSIGFKIDNILGDDRESEYEFFGTENRTFSFRSPQTTLSLNYGIKF
ncbi:TonB-dependent receptor [Nonlabens ulvanivorans]|uniref:TonB-dependent receptor n=1 Tax=Nonlabens ulvanivorans TaxID=906888 RepID=A0A081D677_NONUL|nr:TonB-dependent receptor [Nonlabens ulvanivorans]GAK74423.1 TonB-dependent receptor [Nonlabens ulvanivorans]